jgi:hypothetical protein
MSWPARIIASALVVAVVGARAEGVSTPVAAASAVSAASAGAPIPYRAEPSGTAELATRSVLALVVCALVGGVAIYLLRGRVAGTVQSGHARRVSIMQVQRLTPKHTTVLLRWDDEELLVVVGEGHASLLARKPRAGSSSDEALPEAVAT